MLVSPPQTIISCPVQTAVCSARPAGVVASRRVGSQESVAGSYRPPSWLRGPFFEAPPQTIISLPVHTVVWSSRGSGAPSTGSGSQALLAGLKRPPVRSASFPSPPKTMTSCPVQIADQGAGPNDAG